MGGVELTHHIGDDVHHMAIALDEEFGGHVHGADLRDAAHIVAAEIQQHEMFRPLLGIG